MSALDLLNLQTGVAPVCVVNSKYCNPGITVLSITKSADNNDVFEITNCVQDKLILKATRESWKRLVLRDEEDLPLLSLKSNMEMPPEVYMSRGQDKTDLLCNVTIHIIDIQFRASVKYTDAVSFEKNELVITGIAGSKEIAVNSGASGHEVSVATLRRIKRDNSKSTRELRVAPRVDVAFIVALCLAIERTIKMRQTVKKVACKAAEFCVNLGVEVVKSTISQKFQNK